jgi:hypothetical protein
MTPPNAGERRFANGVTEINRDLDATRRASLTIQTQLNGGSAAARIADRIQFDLLQVHAHASISRRNAKESTAFSEAFAESTSNLD